MGKKGGKKRGRGKNNGDTITRELILKEQYQEYGQIMNNLGDKRFYVKCFDGVTRIGKVRGKMHKKVWINENDIVLVALRPDCNTSDNKVDIILKYSPDEVKELTKSGHIQQSIDTANAFNTDIQPDNIINEDNDQLELNFDDI